MSLMINFKEYAVRNGDGTINENETIAKFQEQFKTDLRNYIDNLEHSANKIRQMVDELIFQHRGEHITGDWVAGEVARTLTNNKPANYSFVKRQVLAFIGENSKGENPRYKSGRGRGNTGLQLLPELYQEMELALALKASNLSEAAE